MECMFDWRINMVDQDSTNLTENSQVGVRLLDAESVRHLAVVTALVLLINRLDGASGRCHG